MIVSLYSIQLCRRYPLFVMGGWMEGWTNLLLYTSTNRFMMYIVIMPSVYHLLWNSWMEFYETITHPLSHDDIVHLLFCIYVYRYLAFRSEYNLEIVVSDFKPNNYLNFSSFVPDDTWNSCQSCELVCSYFRINSSQITQ